MSMSEVLWIAGPLDEWEHPPLIESRLCILSFVELLELPKLSFGSLETSRIIPYPSLEPLEFVELVPPPPNNIQCAGSDTRPPMLDKTDFASWQQRIRLYCRGKENGVNILKSIDEGPFQMGTTRVIVAEGTEGSLNLGPERPRVYSDLSQDEKDRQNKRRNHSTTTSQVLPSSIMTREHPEDKDKKIVNSKFVNNMLPEWGRFVTAVKLNKGLKDSNFDQLYAYLKQHEAHANENKMITSSNPRNQATVQDGRVVVQSVQGRQNRGQGNNARGTGAAGYGGAQNRVGNANPGQARQVKCYNCNEVQENEVVLDEEQLLFLAGGQDNAIDEDVDEQPVQDLALNVDNVFQADDCDAYDSDDAICEHHEEHGMQDDVQPSYIVGSHADYTSDSNMTPYDQYVKDNAMPVVQNNASTVPNDMYVMIDNDLHEPKAQSVFKAPTYTVADNSLNAELAIYKEQVELYERRARFELTEREQKIDEQLRIVICDRNIKEENLKKELHSVKLQLASHPIITKLMVDEVTSLKKDFNQKENKYLEEFLDLKALKDKVNITPPNYSKENFLATFTPQKQLTPEQIFWSQDIVKMKAKALKEQNTRPIKALTVQLFSEFEKTCKKRITPTGITEGERGFEQTKTCYLTEVIPFFKTLQEHFEGIQKALTKEVKEMSDAFDELEAELDQSIVDRKHDEIERKNLLIEHDNIIADGLSKEVFYVASNSELNVSRFTEMQKAHNVVKARCLELEAELSNLRKYAIDVEPIPPHNRNNREVHLYYLRHFKESVDTLREIVEEAKVERPLDRSLASACRYTKHSQELLEYVFGTCPKVFNQQDKKHANTPRKKQVTFKDQSATSCSNTHKHVEPMHTQKSNVYVPPSIGVNSCTDASGSQPRSILKKHRIPLASN
ncbi:hypothetical protein Tco_0414964 [Tanacetum coccineum]